MPKRILMVDDEPWIVHFVGAHLIAEGYEVRAAHSGEEALAALQEFQPEAVILDLMLPGIDGSAVAEQMAERLGLSQLPVVFLSGLITAEQAGLTSNPHHYFLPKPFEPPELFRALAALGV